MGKRARDHRARIRRDNRYLDGRAKPEDQDIHDFGWNTAEVRKLSKWQRQQRQLLFQDELEYLNWLHFGLWRPLVKGDK
jgi:hypothetical protein